jgi:hypothetical protein
LATGNGGDPDTLWMFWKKSNLQKKEKKRKEKIKKEREREKCAKH